MALPHNTITPLEAKMNIQTSDMAGLNVQFEPSAYKRIMLESAKPNLVMNQFGQSITIGKGQGKDVTFNRMAPLPTALTPLVEGITPTGNSLQWSAMTVRLSQFGDYITMSDIVDFAAYNSQAENGAKALGNQAGETLDELTGLALATGTNVQYAGGAASRAALTATSYLAVADIRKAVRTLSRFNARKIKGDYIGIVHPDVVFDLMTDPEWIAVKNYDSKDWYDGEIGRIMGVRFVQSSKAVIFHGGNILDGAEPVVSLQITGVDKVAKKVTVFQNLTSAQATGLAGKKVKINGVIYTIASATAGVNGTATVTFTTDITTLVEPESVMYTANGAANGKDVYATYIFGEDAYGRINLGKGNFEMITKGLGSGGTSDPLNQRSTMGWKASHTALITTQEHFVRVESTTSYDNRA